MGLWASKKANSQTAASKGKQIVNGGTDPTELHLSDPDVVLQQINEEPSSPTPTYERVANEHESFLPAEGWFLHMLDYLQKRLDEQEAKTAREWERAALERDAATYV